MDGIYDTRAFAQLLGLTPRTISTYVVRLSTGKGTQPPAGFPPPDGKVGNSNYWLKTTAEKYARGRRESED